MKNYFVFLILIFLSCSSEDDEIVIPNIASNWQLKSITFNGNGSSGTGDVFFIGTDFELELVDYIFFGFGRTSNAAMARLQIVFLNNGEVKYIPFDDTGLLRSGPLGSRYDNEFKLIDNSGNEITLDIDAYDCTLVISNNELQIDFSANGYNIQHIFTR